MSDSSETANEANGPGYLTGIADGNLSKPVRLSDYMYGVGVLFQLPKRAKAAPAPKAETKRTIAARARVKQALIGLGAVALVVAGFMIFDEFRSEVLPGEISGTWSATEGRYAGRNFWINSKSVAFQDGNKINQFTQHTITKVRSQKAPDGIIYNVDYDESGKPISFVIKYVTAPRPTIRLVSQPAVKWYRTGDAPVMVQ